MRGNRRARQQGLHATEARRDDRERRALHELLRALGRALELETENPAVAFKQLARTRVSRMALEARVVDARYARMRLEELCDPESALILAADPQCERLQPPVEQKGGM